LFGAGVKSRLVIIEDPSPSSALVQDLINSSAIRIDFSDNCTVLPDANEKHCADPPPKSPVIVAILFYTLLSIVDLQHLLWTSSGHLTKCNQKFERRVNPYQKFETYPARPCKGERGEVFWWSNALKGFVLASVRRYIFRHTNNNADA
jgi:hypothetical protein